MDASGRAPAAKRLVIRPLKQRPRLPEDFAAANWAKLQAAVRAVQGAAPVAVSLEELYLAVQDLCLHKAAPALYAQLEAECDRHAREVLEGLAASTRLDGPAFLAQLGAAWDSYCGQMLLIRQIFLYLDRAYVLTAAAAAAGEARSLFEMGLRLFARHLAARPAVGARAVDALLGLVDADRGGEAVDRALLKTLLRMLSSLGVYESAFQRAFLARTVAHYAAEGARLVAELEAPAFLAHAERRLAEEFARCDAYLEPATRRPLVEAVETCLVERHLPTVLEHGLDAMLAENRAEDLARLYALAARVAALAALCAAFKRHVVRAGSAIVLDAERDAEMIPALLRMKARVDALLAGAFAGNPAFANAAKEGFEAVVNQRGGRPAELLAKHMDGVMRGGARGSGAGGAAAAGGDDLEAAADAAMALFRFIQGKDVFEAFYKRDLAKRLLLGRSASADAEKAAIAKLKAECGSQFTSKLEGMFKDVELSRDVMAAFRRAPAAAAALAAAAPGLDLTVQVLTGGFWPTYPALAAKLPRALAAAAGAFADAYLAQHSGRKLAWCDALGTCVVRAAFDAGAKELAVSLFQAVVLELFNGAEELSYAELAEGSGLEEKELGRTLQSLACGRERVLLKEPKGKEVAPSDRFRVNAAYASRLFRVKINAIQLKESAEENARTVEAVAQDRQHAIDAAIVRVMKTRKTLGHRLLVGELVAQLRFPIAAGDLKKRIESLIDREYLERDARDAQVYNYLA
jgi:cullin-4